MREHLTPVGVGAMSAFAWQSDSLAQVPHDVVNLVTTLPPDNLADLKKALISMAVAAISQIILTTVPNLFKTLKNHVKNRKVKKTVQRDNVTK